MAAASYSAIRMNFHVCISGSNCGRPSLHLATGCKIGLGGCLIFKFLNFQMACKGGVIDVVLNARNASLVIFVYLFAKS